MHEGYKVVSTQEMARVEATGDHESFMREAGTKVALVVIHYIQQHDLPKKVTLLVGKGNNGGDAYAAGLRLLNDGFSVFAYPLYEKVAPLNEKLREVFRKQGGKFTEKIEGVLVDGLLGTGCQGRLEKKLKMLITLVNHSNLPVFSIDIPSGVHGSSGRVEDVAIQATATVTLGLAKMGLFIEEGWKYVGKLYIADFGLSQEKIAEAEDICYLPKKLELPKVCRIRHKYEAGYVVGYAGSTLFRGAAKMAGLAALRSGAGMVRVFHSGDIGDTSPELMTSQWCSTLWKKSLKKAKAVFIGPGLGECSKWLKAHVKECKLPCVFDADALQKEMMYPKGSVLTPHRGEALRLFGLKTAHEEDLFARAIRYCNANRVTLVLKGAPTFIFGPDHKPVIIPRGDPGMATAGSGDVLTGMIAAFFAQGSSSYEAAILAVTLHAIAGEYSAKDQTSYCMTAMNLIERLPSAFKALLHQEEIVPFIA